MNPQKASVTDSKSLNHQAEFFPREIDGIIDGKTMPFIAQKFWLCQENGFASCSSRCSIPYYAVRINARIALTIGGDNFRIRPVNYILSGLVFLIPVDVINHTSGAINHAQYAHSCRSL